MMINCLIIDDEPLAVKLLDDFINKVPFLNLVEKCYEPMLAFNYLKNDKIDLLFLDIKMPDISGIDFLKSIHKKPDVIFTTAYQEYAINGFELNAIDYLLKPFSFNRFLAAANKAKNHFELSTNKSSSVSKEYFFINVAHKIHKLFYNDILYLEGYKDYTKVYLTGTVAPLVILHNLKYFEDLFEQNEFVRVHRSFIVPISKISTASRKEVIINNVSIPVSDNYRDKLFAVIS
jgi:two-component system, LytTR family, response regulator